MFGFLKKLSKLFFWRKKKQQLLVYRYSKRTNVMSAQYEKLELTEDYKEKISNIPHKNQFLPSLFFIDNKCVNPAQLTDDIQDTSDFDALTKTYDGFARSKLLKGLVEAEARDANDTNFKNLLIAASPLLLPIVLIIAENL